ncbi:MAG: ABC transporter permease [Oscillospiraceae bacterium]
MTLPEYLLKFPENWQIDIGETIDSAVKSFARNHRDGLGAIKTAVIVSINGIEDFLGLIPWWVLVLAVAVLGWRISKKPLTGVMYGALLMLVGVFGMWTEMLQTIAIVIASVFLSILFGFPLGVFISMNKRAESIIRPVLDLMQTMPSWVYLIPAVILFSVGKTPALMATTIYSIVPMIRMTSLGITHVDEEVIEAARAFGSTAMQTLIKVQIPQSVPTIMAGINQTIMMAMSMVVTCALIGANGLGMEILVATNRTEIGKALLPGISIVIVAIILDRLTQGIVGKQEADSSE